MDAKSKPVIWASAIVPLALLVVLLTVFWRSSGGLRFDAPAPLDKLAFERVVFLPEEIVAHVRNVGPGPVTIAQVQVGWLNRASWDFTVEPSATLERLATARVRIPYPWVPGEPYEIVIFAASGLPFSQHIEVAAETPQLGWRSFGAFAMLGVYVGVIPVFLGILWLPFLRQLGRGAYGFLLSLTVGLLVFLGVDALADALEAAEKLPGAFQGAGLILLGVSLSLLGLYALARSLEARRRAAGKEMSLTLAYLVAFGIGMHNLGEGLAIGSAYALGEIATGALLLVGFMIHNLTEGVAVVAPVLRSKMGAREGGASWWHLLWLGALAGVPTIFGSTVGAFAPWPVLAVFFLSLGAGAVFQVVIEIAAQMRKSAEPGAAGSLAQPAYVGGFLCGLAVMYVTGLFLAV
jgi:ZIP family zinc transporter